MNKKAKGKIVIILISVLLILAAAAGVGIRYFSQRIQATFSYSDEVFGNPLMGYARSAWYEDINDDITLLYVDITWRELEPEEGVFDWEGIEEENQLNRWRAEGKHIVLRFVCDIPGEEAHLDIPDWLYEKTEGAGTSYDTSYGRGFSPDYENEIFIACHQRAVEALGQQYGQDTFISFIELGSLGHWGEWHTDSSAGIKKMPAQQVREQYVQHWVEAFPHARLLMRRPFAEAEQYGLGLYNDMAGDKEDTEEWLAWITEGGVYDQTGEEHALIAMPDAWKTAPIGGEFTSSLDMKQMLETELAGTVSLIRDSHTTFLGPKIADSQYADGYDAVLLNMGYRLWISGMELSPRVTGGVEIKLTWQNSGVAPLYEDWPAHFQVTDEEGRIVEAVLVDILSSHLLPGDTVQTSTVLHQPETWDSLDRYTIQIGIIDPMTGKNAVRFAVDGCEQEDGALVLWNPREGL